MQKAKALDLRAEPLGINAQLINAMGITFFVQIELIL